MTLTEDEMRWIKKREKQERLWPKTRWLLIFIGLFSLGVAVFIFYSFSGDDATSQVMFAGMWPLALLFFVKGLAWIALAIAHWRGHFETKLLLRLVAEHQNSDSRR
jgi:hypothetical protein